jgi:integrase/recombinase XerC/integrase/recombinase XerD
MFRVVTPVESPLDASLQAFLLDREASRCTAKTLQHYQYTVGSFVEWLKRLGIQNTHTVTAPHIRAYLVELQRKGLKDTTQHAHARGIKTWLNWLMQEGDLTVSPMAKVKMPRQEKRVPAPFTSEDIKALLACCDRKTPVGARNYAILLTLLDTGLRSSEFMSLRTSDINMRDGTTTVMGKGQKQRQIRIGNKARSAILMMLGFRPNASHGDPLWASYDSLDNEVGVLKAGGLTSILKRLGHKANVSPCSPHRFRRTFALWCLRDGMDLHSLRLLMGHENLQILQRYLALAGEDIERAHRLHSPADNLL